MYSEEPAVKSAKRIWDAAKPSRRLQLLREAGCCGFGNAYRKFDDLPITMKLDLNDMATRQSQEIAA